MQELESEEAGGPSELRLHILEGLRDRATVTRMQDGDSTTLTFCPCLALSIIFFLLPFWGGKCNYITLYFNLQKSEIC